MPIPVASDRVNMVIYRSDSSAMCILIVVSFP